MNVVDNGLYSSEDHVPLQDLFGIHKILMVVSGQYPKGLLGVLPKWLGYYFRTFLTGFYSAFVVLHFFGFVILYIKTALDGLADGDLEGMSNAIAMALIHFVAGFSCAYTLFRLETFFDFFDFINKSYKHHSLAGLTFVTYFDSYRKARLVVITWTGSCFVGVCIWCIAPILLGQHTLPFKCWYPYDVMQPIIYEINYFIQFYDQVLVGITFGIFSGAFISFVLIVLGQFDILYCSLKNLNFHAKLLSGVSIATLRKMQQDLPSKETKELNEYVVLKEHLTDLGVFKIMPERKYLYKKQFPLALHVSLIKCVEMHHFLIKAYERLENFYHPACLVISMQVIVQLCFLIFAAVTGENSGLKIFNQVQYFFLTLCNLAIYTFSGELLRQHSVRCAEAFWRSQWSSDELYLIRKDLLIFLTNSNHSFRLTAAKFFNIDIYFFRKAIAQTFSFFTLLRKISAKNDHA